MERQEFENSWKDAFKDSEIIPSDNVWTNIELDLERERAAVLRRRLVRYQWLAAASVVFSIGVSIAFFTSTEKISAPLAQVAENSSVTQNDVIANSSTSDKQQSGSDKLLLQTEGQADQSNKQISNTVNKSSHGQRKIGSQTISAPNRLSESANSREGEIPTDNSNSNAVALLENKASQDEEPLNKHSASLDIPGNVADKQANLVQLGVPKLNTTPSNEADPVALMMAKLEQREKEIAGPVESDKNESSKVSEKLWSSVGFAAGSFKSVNSGTSPALADASTKNAFASSIAKQETKAAGVAYSMGINIGTRIAERWVLQGGVNYLNQTSAYTQETLIQTPNFTSFRPASINELNQLAVGDVVEQKNAIATAPYDVNNNVRYLSIPLQAGFLILNRGLGVQMNAGVATDLFLQNTISATSDGERVDPVKAGIGGNTAFRPLNFSGLMGTEVSYKFSKHYRISLNPGLRYPFNNIYKSQDYRASRFMLDVGLRFRYIFH